MSVFDNMKRDMTELIRLVRESASYCTAISAKPELATTESHGKEILREQRIAELTHLYGLAA